MKKILLSIFVVVAFIAYTFQQRHESSATVVSPSTSSNSSTTQTSSPTSTSSPPTATTSSTYKDGSYTGDVTDAFYGNVQIQATIQGGKITDVTFLQYPNDRENSVRINSVAMPYLKQEAIKAQSAHVDIVSGATDTSNAFIQSLTSALAQAQA